MALDAKERDDGEKMNEDDEGGETKGDDFHGFDLMKV